MTCEDKFFNSEIIRCAKVIENYLRSAPDICLGEDEISSMIENLNKLRVYLMEINVTEVE